PLRERPFGVFTRAVIKHGFLGLPGAPAARWLAYALPYRRFVICDARLGADVVRYSFIAGRDRGTARATLEPESEVCTVDQEATSVSRFSMIPIIASLAKPTAIMTSAS